MRGKSLFISFQIRPHSTAATATATHPGKEGVGDPEITYRNKQYARYQWQAVCITRAIPTRIRISRQLPTATYSLTPDHINWENTSILSTLLDGQLVLTGAQSSQSSQQTNWVSKTGYASHQSLGVNLRCVIDSLVQSDNFKTGNVVMLSSQSRTEDFSLLNIDT
jgi:hypothetical protein